MSSAPAYRCSMYHIHLCASGTRASRQELSASLDVYLPPRRAWRARPICSFVGAGDGAPLHVWLASPGIPGAVLGARDECESRAGGLAFAETADSRHDTSPRGFCVRARPGVPGPWRQGTQYDVLTRTQVRV